MAEYAERDPRSLEPYYSRHVDAMTVEYLHNKSDIAAELAFRDQQRFLLQQEVNGLIDRQNGVRPPGSQEDLDCARRLQEVSRRVLKLLVDVASNGSPSAKVLAQQLSSVLLDDDKEGAA